MVAIKKILCPVDFFDASKFALKYAVALAASHDAQVKLLHVVSPIISHPYPYPVEAVNLSGSMKKDAEHELGKMLAALKRKNKTVTFEAEVVVGDIDLELQRAINRYKPDLITMGTHGRRSFERWFLGSTTERLLRHSPVPLLTITAPTKPKRDIAQFRRIVVTTDFSDGTADALDYAFTIAQENNSVITLLHVVDREPTEFTGEDRAVFFREVHRQLSDRVPPQATNWCNVKIRVEQGMPYQVILKKLETEKVDLLVMNIHGKGMLERALLGTTAERVLRAAHCPIIMVPPMKNARKKAQSGKWVA